MFSLGLSKPSEGTSVFLAVAAMLWRPALFPAISTLESLSNRRWLPTLCAADDLDLLAPPDHLEFFNDFAVQNVEFSEFNFDVEKPQFDPPVFDFGVKVPQPDYLDFSHFKLNMIGLNPSPYFQDFYPQKSSPQLVVLSDSNLAAPLDDEFVPFPPFPKEYIQLVPEMEPMPARKRKMSDEVSVVLEEQPMRKMARPQRTAFDCSHCNALFKVKGYLTRHLKKHSTAKAFTCPFYEEEGILGTKCHPTGGFSRRDTFKTHLKALHFIYPPGTKQTERNEVGGRCAGCFEHFENNLQWLVRHIEAGECKGTICAKLDPVVKTEHDY